MHASKTSVTLLALSASLLFAACGKKAPAPADAAPPPPVAVTPAAVPAPSPAPTAEPSDEQRELAGKQRKMDFATMEDGYINDARAQWAIASKASSSFGEVGDKVPKTPQESRAWRTTGAIDGDTWINNSQNIGFDWLELTYDRPVSATEVRVVGDGQAMETLSKVELVDTDGKAHTVWTGISDVKRDERGPRSWFVRKFDATPYKVRSVKVTIANNLSSGYKEIDAVQLVGD